MDRQPPGRRQDYLHFSAIGLRWNDNDVFGHVNNAQYYGFFDTAVMRFLLEGQALTITGGETGMVVVESGCRYHSEVIFTDDLEIGLRVAAIGNSSVRYELAAFVNRADTAAAEGHFVHVFIDRASKRPTRIPDPVRAHLSSLLRH